MATLKYWNTTTGAWERVGVVGPPGPQGPPGADGSGSVDSVNGVTPVSGNVTLVPSDIGALALAGGTLTGDLSVSSSTPATITVNSTGASSQLVIGSATGNASAVKFKVNGTDIGTLSATATSLGMFNAGGNLLGSIDTSSNVILGNTTGSLTSNATQPAVNDDSNKVATTAWYIAQRNAAETIAGAKTFSSTVVGAGFQSTTGIFKATASLADATNKSFNLTSNHYTIAEEDFLILVGQSKNGANNLNFGGGSPVNNSATNISFYTAPDGVTLSGTQRMVVTGAGNVGINQPSPGEKLDVIGNGLFSGTVTATSFSGSGAALTGLTATQVGLGNVTNSAQVDISSTQTITGAKQFNNTVTFADAADTTKRINWDVSSITPGQNRTMQFPNAGGVITLIAAVQTLTNKTMSGASNTFSNIPISAVTGTVPIAQIPTGTTSTTVSLGNHNHDTAYVALTGAQTVAGIKTFSSAPNLSSLTASTVVILDASKNVASSAVTTTELGYLTGVTSAIQTQINAKAPTASPTFTGTVTAGTFSGSGASLTNLPAANLTGTAPIGSIPTGTTGTTVALGNHLHTGVYEPVLAAGTAAQYYRGDKSWQTLDKTAVGLSNINNVAQVEIAGTQTITGAKTFSVAPVVPDSSFSIAKTTGLQSALDGKAASSHTHTKSEITDFAHTHAAADVTSGTFAQARVVPNQQVFMFTTGSETRPTGSTYVKWVGPVTPTNAIDGDEWVNTA